MQWIFLIIVSSVPAVAMVLAVSGIARLALLVRSPSVRKWVATLLATILLAPIPLLAIAASYLPDVYPHWSGVATEEYRAYPSLMLLLAAPLLAAVGTFLAAFAYGFLPVRGLPYEPRAASWSLRRLSLLLVILVGVLIAATFVQDFTLRRALDATQLEAEAVARQLVPPAVPAEDNAAVHYQHVIDLMEESEEWCNSRTLDAVSDRLATCDVENDEVQDYFQQLDPICKELRLAATCKTCRFDDKYAPLDVISAVQSRVRLMTALKALGLLADYEVCRDRSADAVASLEAIRSAEAYMRADPRAIECAYFYWLELRIRQSVEHLAAHSKDLPTEAVRSLIETEPLPAKEIYRDAVKWEAASIQMALVKLYRGAEYDQRWFQKALGEDAAQAPRGLMLQGFRLTTERDELAAVKAAFPFTVRPNDDGAWQCHWDDVTPQGKLVAAARSVGNSPSWLNRAGSHRQLANIGIAAALYRRDAGHWPAALAALAPKFLTKIPEYSDSEPYHVMSIDGGLMVYSSNLNEMFEKFEDTREWWSLAAEEFRNGSVCLFLGRARERVMEFKNNWQ